MMISASCRDDIPRACGGLLCLRDVESRRKLLEADVVSRRKLLAAETSAVTSVASGASNGEQLQQPRRWGARRVCVGRGGDVCCHVLAVRVICFTDR